MGMKEILKDAKDKLRSGQLANEAQVKQAVILPILRELGWDDANPREFVPEYPVDRQVSRGSVDYALIPEDVGHPMVFIEAKRVGNVTEAGEEQVFSYATNKGIPFLILTDGNIWRFYLSMAAGVPSKRKFHEIELQQGQWIDVYARFLEEYLHKNRVGLPDTRHGAERLLNERLQRVKARAAIPDVWRTLLETPDQSLCVLVMDSVEKEYRIRPSTDDVRAFLNGFLVDSSLSSERSIERQSATVDSPRSGRLNDTIKKRTHPLEERSLALCSMDSELRREPLATLWLSC